MTIGLPRAFLYYRYHDLWEAFFESLNVETIVSEETNIRILTEGINQSIDESCLPAKIYMGHVASLIGRCDYILVPRIQSFGRKEITCTKFHGIYDIVSNTFKDAPLLNYDINLIKGRSERSGFIKMGMKLRKGCLKSAAAYKKAKQIYQNKIKEKHEAQELLLKAVDKLKILIVSHPYITYDKLAGKPVIDYIKESSIVPIYADAADTSICIEKSKIISDSIYWTYNKELIGAIELYKNKVDGIILLTAFPCGPDSLVNELIISKIKNPPIINIILDELKGEAGIQTRIESFIDIIYQKRRKQVG